MEEAIFVQGGGGGIFEDFLDKVVGAAGDAVVTAINPPPISAAATAAQNQGTPPVSTASAGAWFNAPLLTVGGVTVSRGVALAGAALALLLLKRKFRG